MKISIITLLSFGRVNGQHDLGIQDTIPSNRVLDINPRRYQSNDTMWIYSGICKPLKRTMFYSQNNLSQTSDQFQKSTPFITIHGLLQYDFLYRSFADTPFYQKDFRQHTIRTSLTVTVKEKYPFRINLIVRKSNSPYFKNYLDGGLLFDRESYIRKLKEQLYNKISTKLPGKEKLDSVNALLQKNIRQYNLLKDKLASPDLAQRLIEERELKYFESLNKPSFKVPADSNLLAKKDSLEKSLSDLVKEKKNEFDSLKSRIDVLKGKADSIQQALSVLSWKIKHKINNAKSLKELQKLSKDFAMEAGKENPLTGRWEKFINDIKSVGIGRSVVNYSELTASNVSLTGINVEYTPRLYYAFAAGKIDYGFRDFFGRNNRSSQKQYLTMGRIGLGDPDKRAVIFSLFTGRKSNYGSLLSDTVSGNILITGYSIETILKKDENSSIRAELAKSTRPLTGRIRDNKEFSSLFRFSDNSNLGVSIKGQTLFSKTHTRLYGMFRKTGENFQSFSLFSYNTDQTAWMLKADQPIWKDRINFTGIVRRNDFVNPFTEKTYKTTTVFSSALLTVRIPGWPVLSAGYYPGSQLYIIDQNRVRENVYYILNGSLVYQYKAAGLRMISSALYNQYTTKGTDSGFINYSGINYLFSQTISSGRMQLQGNFNYTDQQEMKFYSMEGTADLTLRDYLRVGSGVKCNKILNGGIYWGGSAQFLLVLKKLGTLQLQYEKSFLPTIQQTLFPVETGRISWLKNF